MTGACVRATWVRSTRINSERGIDIYKTLVLPALDELEGFCSASLMVDRGSGRCVASASYDSMEALERNKEQLDSLKTARTQEAGAEVLDECDFELTLAHLRVPEMA